MLTFNLSSVSALTCVLSVFDPLQIEEENAALLAALTDSLDGMVDAEVGGLSVFPALEEEPDQEEEEDDHLPLSAGDFGQSLGAESEDPSLVSTSNLTEELDILTSGARYMLQTKHQPIPMMHLSFLFPARILICVAFTDLDVLGSKSVFKSSKTEGP